MCQNEEVHDGTFTFADRDWAGTVADSGHRGTVLLCFSTT